MFHSIESDDEVDDAYAFNAVFGFWCEKLGRNDVCVIIGKMVIIW